MVQAPVFPTVLPLKPAWILGTYAPHSVVPGSCAVRSIEYHGLAKINKLSSGTKKAFLRDGRAQQRELPGALTPERWVVSFRSLLAGGAKLERTASDEFFTHTRAGLFALAAALARPLCFPKLRLRTFRVAP